MNRRKPLISRMFDAKSPFRATVAPPGHSELSLWLR